MVEQLSETMPDDVREAFADAVRLYSQWSFDAPNVPAPTLAFRTLKVSLSGICDLVAAYKNEPLPLARSRRALDPNQGDEAESRACNRSILCHWGPSSRRAHSRAPGGL